MTALRCWLCTVADPSPDYSPWAFVYAETVNQAKWQALNYWTFAESAVEYRDVCARRQAHFDQVRPTARLLIDQRWWLGCPTCGHAAWGTEDDVWRDDALYCSEACAAKGGWPKEQVPVVGWPAEEGQA